MSDQKDNQIISAEMEMQYAIMEKVIIDGDLSKLSAKERVGYYHHICKTLNLNPATRPFQYIRFDGKLVLYPSKDCTEQMRKLNGISITKLEKEMIGDVYCVTAYIQAADGRTDVATGAVVLKGLTGKMLANAYKIAETQAKRRATLSICGLGWTDESEITDVPNAEPARVDFETGEIIDAERELNLDEAIQLIQTSEGVEALLLNFKRVYKAFRHDENAIQQLIKAKDERKIELSID